MVSLGLSPPSHRRVPGPGCTGHSVPPLGNRGHPGQAQTQVWDSSQQSKGSLSWGGTRMGEQPGSAAAI